MRSRPNMVINYGRTAATPGARAIGMDETAYESPKVLANDPLEQQRLKRLRLGYVRMDLVYAMSGDPTSKIECGADGCDRDPSGDQWITAIKGIGAQPVVVVRTTSSVDAVNMVKHFNVNPATGQPDTSLRNYVRYWIIGNEPNINGYSSQAYSQYFNADYDAMKAVDPNIKIGGPTIAWYDQSWIQQFLQGSGSRVDFVDFHGYPQSGTTPGDVTTLFKWASSTGGDVRHLRTLISSMLPGRASSVGIEVGEWSLDSGGSAQLFTNFNAVWTADVLGNILRSGGQSLYYGTKGNALKWSDGYVTNDHGVQTYMHLDDP
ncbi:MAG TPA: hypothetical protein VK771_08930, partial [Acidimicrobiia bacterium]|nr:hypothetical protein [Acidimicrobiia bacterium]